MRSGLSRATRPRSRTNSDVAGPEGPLTLAAQQRLDDPPHPRFAQLVGQLVEMGARLRINASWASMTASAAMARLRSGPALSRKQAWSARALTSQG